MHLNRRSLLAGAAASTVLSISVRAQILPPAGFATPSGTLPFPPDVYRERRARLMATLKDGVALIHGAQRGSTSGPVSPPFYQSGDFAWLTGIVDEPGAVLVLAPAERTYREFLLLPSRDIETERWDVERLPLGSQIEARTGIQRVRRVSALDALVTGIAARSHTLHFMGPIASAGSPVPPALDLYSRVMARVPGCTLKDQSALIPALRTVKEPRELDLMRRATAATKAGHLAAMKAVRPGMTERQLTAILEAGFRDGGGEGLSYDSIVATGRNAASLHYAHGTAVIGAQDLVLIDAAASVGTYACDVTRTFPASGKFTPAQRADYELVLAAQDAAAKMLKAGVIHEDMTEAANAVFRKAGRIDEFTHGLGHFVGLDVHDAGDYTKPLPAGAVLTIEPGLYNQQANQGIRIEDLYLVTATGAERLSTGIPRTVEEIEVFMAR
ncbi:aminopeptidase P family protein [Novosphingobium sp. MMS21-SN21R]|uniref:aminopeptidase P family protein n=1 Tax=Novosphingobium sp. MMS21-SN21R TaxID=2969298 RepID=UPI002888A936|nr:aminopeptidase P family protein [Novosphingobium sp. MMS21-SN21R]MDT0506471.1 aminopeptidase P family protein [Novosphingobium sp. MMS21-SN21R]